MPNNNIQFDDDYSSQVENTYYRNVMGTPDKGMIGWVVKRFGVKRNVAQMILIGVSLVFFLAAALIFVSRFVL